MLMIRKGTDLNRLEHFGFEKEEELWIHPDGVVIDSLGNIEMSSPRTPDIIFNPYIPDVVLDLIEEGIVIKSCDSNNLDNRLYNYLDDEKLYGFITRKTSDDLYDYFKRNKMNDIVEAVESGNEELQTELFHSKYCISYKFGGFYERNQDGYIRRDIRVYSKDELHGIIEQKFSIEEMESL